MITRSFLLIVASVFGLILPGYGAAQPGDLFVFQSWAGDPNKPESMAFQLNPTQVAGSPKPHTVFLKLGDLLPGTDFTLKSFVHKELKDPALSEPRDVSELTVQNKKTNETLTLHLAQQRNVIGVGELKNPAATTVLTDVEAAQHVGEKATVRGKVVGVGTSKQGNIYLNFGNAFPKQTFSVAIKAKDAGKFDDTKRFEGKTVSVTGTITLYNEKPEIIVAEPGDLQIQEDSAAPATSPKP